MPPGNDFLCSNLLVISPQDDLLFGPWSRVLSLDSFFNALVLATNPDCYC